ncbi:MAG: DUF1631 family protein [Hydrogenophaga sp.]|uniref:DUF1631 family protein n=1 Tax=Hydrogenophaga sp. TaxID=1904254 RepID=UPI002ABB4389|nr:DUF1631 family protein [Hydrogenophaga sp.]MDZ4100181.1 DUF1631 family protein [Hydrogenophaga sp.]
MKVPPRLLQQCLGEVLEDAPAMLGRWLDAAVDSMKDAERRATDTTQRERLGQAWWRMRQEKAGWMADYARRLRDAFAMPVDAPQSSRSALLSESNYLSLVEDDAVTESIESARLLQSLLPPLEQELKVLDALMSSLQGLSTVQSEQNPLRPSIFVRTLRDMMALDEPDSQIRALWLRHCGPAIGSELKALYVRLTLVLQRANVQEAGYRVRLLAEAPGAAARSAAQAARAARAGAAGWSPSGPAPLDPGSDSTRDLHFGGFMHDMPQLARLQTPVDNQYLHNFLEKGGQRYEQSLAPEYYEQVSEELAAIEAFAAIPTLDESMVVRRSEQYKALPVVDRPAREVDIGTQLSQKTWGDFAAAHERARVLMQLKQKAERVAQAMGLDVVRKLVNQVAQDPLLLAPVREAVVALEPSLLRLAMANPRFFSEDAHPARRLVECVAQRSFKYNDEFASEFAEFFLPVQQAFNALNELETDDAQAFAIALDELLQEWEGQDRQDLAAQDENLQAIRRAEARQTLADQVAWDLSQRPDVDHAPGFILDFLYGPWALAIASAQLNADKGQVDPGGYRKVVSNLLWSTQKDVTLRMPAQLLEMVPGMLATLHAGLESLGRSRVETKPFFDALMRLHQPVLGLRRARARADASASNPVPLEASSMSMELDETLAATPEQRKPRKSDQPWLGREELEAAGFQDTMPTDFAELIEFRAPNEATPFDAADESETGREEDIPFDAVTVLAGLREGDWVDLYSHREWLRAQLIWASNRGTLFMFVSRGGRPHSMTKRSCERLIANRLLRPVDGQSVVRKAINAIAADQARVADPLPA